MQPLPEAGRPHRYHHKLLDLHIVGGVGTAIEDIHHGQGQTHRPRPPQVAVKGQACRCGRRPGRRQGDAEDGVGPQAALVRGTVPAHHGPVQPRLIQHVPAPEQVCQLAVDPFHGALYPFAAVAKGVLRIPQLPGLMDPGRGPGGYRCPAGDAVFQRYLCLYGGIAPGVQNLPAPDPADGPLLCHIPRPFFTSLPSVCPELGRKKQPDAANCRVRLSFSLFDSTWLH